MMQLQMQILLSYQVHDTGHEAQIDNAIFMWRASTVYLPAILGLGGFLTYLIVFIKARKNKKPIFKN
jgi:uncharacterized membrane protein YbhN (UPF0104 family)